LIITWVAGMLAAAAWDLQGIGTTMEEDGGEGFF